MGASPKKETRSKPVSEVCQENGKACMVTVSIMVVILLMTTGLPKPRSDDTHMAAHYQHSSSLRREDSSSPWFVNGPLEGEFNPKMVWLMSFPNSGTSYTMMSVLRSSNFSTATNYGDEVTKEGDNSLSIYPRRQEGPYWLGLSGKLGKPRPLPSKYIMVKTHCGSRCIKCGPKDYVETLESFIDACRISSGHMPPNADKLEFYYPTSRVHKAIHLVRNPLHNFVARFHLDYKNAIQRKNQKWLDQHPNDAKGFRRWCKELDEKYVNDEFEVFPNAVMVELKVTPCHGEVFKYVQWHNMAFETIEQLGVPSLLVHYEEYAEETFEETFQTILDFLELPRVADPKHEFSPSNYSDYMTEEEKSRMKETIKLLASPKTWNEVEQYFL